MHPKLEKTLQLHFFSDEGFFRKKCSSCKSFFWTKNAHQKLCGDAPCSQYSFIDNPVGKKMDLHTTRETFLSFFEQKNHTRLSRYPVIARWRNDIYLTIASIADFQPHVTSGLVPPPANPLVISQPSIRLNDLNQVGISGRHLTLFEMMGHHAFNTEKERIYWTEETVSLCNEFLIKNNITDVTYKEAEWAGGGNAGACLEVLCRGLEIATLVFMNLKEDRKGSYTVKGVKYTEMPLEVVDTGYGLERFVWLTHGSKTIYDAIFPDVIEYIAKYSQKHDSSSYIIGDHARCLAFMLADGIVPSNTGAGYLGRLLIRRALRFMSKVGFEKDIFFVVEQHMKYLARDFPTLLKERAKIKEILELESEKYQTSVQKGKMLVKRHIERKKEMNIDDLIEFYDSHGIHPEIVKEVTNITIPDNFEGMVADRHLKSEEQRIDDIIKKYKTKCIPLYYENDYDNKFNAKIIETDKFSVILDKTLFYPEGGGQKTDKGILEQNGITAKVITVEKIGDSIVHHIDKKLSKGPVKGTINWKRRYAMMKHHTATHVINFASRKILGTHIWQAGSELDEKEARLDISHYKRITEEELIHIENMANMLVSKGLPVTKTFIQRDKAEKSYGLRLYQGGAPKSSIVRIVNIADTEIEACGGMHVNNTSEIGLIKIVGVERLQDGVERIRFRAGDSALTYVQDIEKKFKKGKQLLHAQTDTFLPKIERLLQERKRLEKMIKSMQTKLGNKNIEKYDKMLITVGEFKIPVLRKLTTNMNTFAISGSTIANKKAMLTIARSANLKTIDASVIAKMIAEKYGGKGGGKPDFAQVGGFDIKNLDQAKKDARDIAIKQSKSKKNKENK